VAALQAMRCDAFTGEPGGDVRKSRRVARHEHAKGIRVTLQQLALRIEEDRLLARVSAAGDPYGPARCMVGAQLTPARDGLLGDREIELEIAGDVSARRGSADRAKALRIRRRLGGDDDTLREGVLEETEEPAVAAHRARRNPRARQDERYATRTALVIQIRPKLGFKDDSETRSHPLEKAARGTRQIKRHEAHVHPVAEERACALRSGRSRRGEYERYGGVASSQIEHQRGGCLYLPYRYGVHPNAWQRERAAEAQALGEVVPVAALAPAAP